MTGNSPSYTKTFYSGQAEGQIRIFSQDVFNALGRPIYTTGYAHVLIEYRQSVFEKFLKKPAPASLTDGNLRGNYAKQANADEELEKASGTKALKTTEHGFGMAGIYMHTLLSGHFLTEQEWQKTISNATPKGAARWDIAHVLGSLLDQSEYHFAGPCVKVMCVFQRAQNERKQVGIFWATCEEMEVNFQSKRAAATP
jgi:hypothetical protein